MERFFAVREATVALPRIALTVLVSQFTLFATTKKGNKPDFHASASGEKAKTLYDHFYKQIQTLHGADKVKNGQFAAMMDVALVNDGPVSLHYFSDRTPANRVTGHYSDRQHST
jgi:D-tyrosyl-tRNA(Tyr) deacylase